MRCLCYIWQTRSTRRGGGTFAAWPTRHPSLHFTTNGNIKGLDKIEKAPVGRKLNTMRGCRLTFCDSALTEGRAGARRWSQM